METKNVITSILLVVLFIIAFISFGINFADEQNAPVNINNDSRVNTLYSGMNDTVYDYDDKGLQSTANDTSSTFDEEDTAGEKISEFIVSAILGVGKSIMSVISHISDAIMDPLLKIVFPNSPEVRSVIGTILMTIIMFIIVLLTLKMIKVGY